LLTKIKPNIFAEPVVHYREEKQKVNEQIRVIFHIFSADNFKFMPEIFLRVLVSKILSLFDQNKKFEE
jgi:hypothetical protein